jgi:hypothetical protein
MCQFFLRGNSIIFTDFAPRGQAVEVGHLSPQPQHQMRILLAQIIKGPKITIYEFLQHQPRIAS